MVLLHVFFRRKLTNQMKELEEALSAAQSKHSSLEKTKNRIAAELEDVSLDLEKVFTSASVSVPLCYHVGEECSC